MYQRNVILHVVVAYIDDDRGGTALPMPSRYAAIKVHLAPSDVLYAFDEERSLTYEHRYGNISVFLEQ
jgi:hypothetical protein